MKNQQKAYILALTSVLLWSTVSTAFKIALINLDYVQLLFVSTVVSAIICFIALVVSGKIKLVFENTSKHVAYSALVALLNPFIYYLVLFKAYSLLPAQVAQPLNYLWPIVLVLLSAPFLKQKIEPKSLIALLVSFTGVIVIALQGNLTNFKIDEPYGVFLACFSSVIWATYWLLNMKDKRDSLVKLFLSFSIAIIYELLAIYFLSDFKINFIDKSFYAAVYVGFFELGITFIVWMSALKYTVRNDKISNLIFLSPALALFFIRFVLNEKIFYTTYIGLFLILCGIYILNKKK